MNIFNILACHNSCLTCSEGNTPDKCMTCDDRSNYNRTPEASIDKFLFCKCVDRYFDDEINMACAGKQKF